MEQALCTVDGNARSDARPSPVRKRRGTARAAASIGNERDCPTAYCRREAWNERVARTIAAAVLVFSALIGACLADPQDEAAVERLHEEVLRLIGEAPCANLVHCRVLALGSRPCGGADEYLAYSSITGNKELLESKAFEYGFLQEEVMRARKQSGTCEVLPTPRVMCLDRRCRLDRGPH
jgi:hypothetical protein